VYIISEIKLLFSCYDGSRYINRSFHLFRQEVARQTRVAFWHKKGDIQEILKRIPFKPDFIILHLSPGLTGLDKINIPKAIILDDAHGEITKKNKEVIIKGKIDLIFSRVNEAFPKYYPEPEFKKKFVWLPKSADTRVFRDYKSQKPIDFLLMGRVNEYYPFREKVLERFKNVNGFVYHPHPGQINVYGNEKGVFSEADYAKEINRAKIFFACGSKHNYPVAKYFEVLACNTLLLAPSNKDLESLGFRDRVHFVECNENNFYEKAMYYLKNVLERKTIACNGFRFVRSKHSTALRAAEFINHLKNYKR